MPAITKNNIINKTYVQNPKHLHVPLFSHTYAFFHTVILSIKRRLQNTSKVEEIQKNYVKRKTCALFS